MGRSPRIPSDNNTPRSSETSFVASAATNLSGENTSESSNSHDGFRRVLLDGHILGLECQSLVLWEFVAADFPECHLETGSGALYTLFRQGNEFVMAQVLGHGQNVRAAVVPSEVINWAVLKVGEPFNYGSGRMPALRSITVVTRTEFLPDEPTPEEAVQVAREHTGGRMSDVRRRFRTLVALES